MNYIPAVSDAQSSWLTKKGSNKVTSIRKTLTTPQQSLEVDVKLVRLFYLRRREEGLTQALHPHPGYQNSKIGQTFQGEKEALNNQEFSTLESSLLYDSLIHSFILVLLVLLLLIPHIAGLV
jgi:hypothetical protein